MDTSEIRLFLSLCNFLSYRKTAEFCSVTPSTLSRAIIRMETELQTKLFERNNQSVELTTAGKKFKEFASDYYLNYLKIKEDLKSIDEPVSGRLRIFCSVTACLWLLPNLLNRYRYLYPNIDLKIETTHGFTKIPLVFIAPKKIPVQWLKKGNIDKKNVPYVIPEQGALRKEINTWFNRNHIRPNINAEVAGNEAIVSLVALGMGIAIIPEAVLKQTSIATDIQIIERPSDISPFNVGLCVHQSKSKDIKVKAFIEIAKNTVYPQI